MSHQPVLTSKNCRKRLLSVQVTTTLVSLAGLTPSITITITTNQTREAQVHTRPVCAFRSTQPVTHSNSAHESSKVQEEFFLLTKERGISFCILRRQMWGWGGMSFTVARSWIAIPAQWCSDRCHGHTIRSLFVLTLIALPLKVKKSRFFYPWLIHILLYLDWNNALNFQLYFDHCFSNQFQHFYLPFLLSIWALPHL